MFGASLPPIDHAGAGGRAISPVTMVGRIESCPRPPSISPSGFSSFPRPYSAIGLAWHGMAWQMRTMHRPSASQMTKV